MNLVNRIMGCCSCKAAEYVADVDNPKDATSVQETGSGDFSHASQSSKSIIEALEKERKLNESTQDAYENNENFHDELTWVKRITPPDPPEKFPYYVTAPVEELHWKLFETAMEVLVKHGMFYTSKEGRQKSPFEFKGPHELRTLLDLNLPMHGVSQGKLLELIRGILKYQPHTGHPFFMEGRTAGLEPYAVISDMVASATNSNNVLYIVSMATTLLELELIRAICQLVGYDADGDGDGAITPGSSLANGYAMRMAVKQKFPQMKRQGLSGYRRPCFFVAQNSQYAYLKNAIFQGFGTNSVVPVLEDLNGRMRIDDLKQKIKDTQLEGHLPCMVVGTAGSSTLRAIDPLNKIAEVCKEHNLWFHCDATFGGHLLCSSKHQSKLRGVERSDSFTWSQHFVIGVPATCTSFIVPPRHKDKLTQYLGLGEGTAYGFMKTPLYDPKYDISHNTILSCRRPEMFKFWFAWKAKGTKGLGMHVDHIMKNAKFCLDEIVKRAGFVPVCENFEGSNVCFYYVPKLYRQMDVYSETYRKKVSHLTQAIRKILVMKNIACVNYAELISSQHLPTFLVLGLHNSAVTRKDIIFVLDRIQYFGEALVNESHDKHRHYHSLISARGHHHHNYSSTSSIGDGGGGGRHHQYHASTSSIGDAQHHHHHQHQHGHRHQESSDLE